MALGLALALALSMVAPGGGGRAGAADGLKIGVCLRITGEIGYKLRQTVEKAFDDINKAGGINGRNVQLIIYDEASSPATATDAINRLIHNDNVLLVMGPTTSSSALATIGLGDRARCVLITPQASNTQLTHQRSEWFFRMAVADVYHAHTLADYLAGDRGFKRFGVVYETEALGVGQSKDFIDRLKAKWNVEPLLVEKFSLGDIDFKSQMLKVKEANPEVVVMAGHEVEMARAISQAYDVGLSRDIVKGGFSSMSSNEYFATAGNAATGSIFVTTFSPNNPDPRIQAFVKDYEATLGTPPDHNHAQAYDAVQIIAMALKQADIQNTAASLAKDRENIRDALGTIKDHKGLSGVCSFGPNPTPEDRDGMKQSSVWQLKSDGSFDLLKAAE
jgi:branched-chain amino acid transport system substrate-binding protein